MEQYLILISELRWQVELDALNYTVPPYATEYPDLLTIYDDSPCVPVHNEIIGNCYCHDGSPSGL